MLPWLSSLCILFLATLAVTEAQLSPTMPHDFRSDLSISNNQRHALDGSVSGLGAYYVENHGQWDDNARYLLCTEGLDVWLNSGGVVYDLYRVENSKRSLPFPEGDRDPSIDGSRSGHIVQMIFVGASRDVALTGDDQVPGYYNYFIGNDTSRWASNVPRFEHVIQQGLYPGIDAIYYVERGRPRYDLLVAPGANPRSIAMEFLGADNPRIDSENALIVETSIGQLRQEALRAYQIIDGRQHPVSCRFAIRTDGTVGFDLGDYDPAYPLTIDPLVYSTFIGGNNYNNAYGIALDSSGNVYVTGSTQSNNYPTTTGAYKTTFAKSSSSFSIAFVTKLNATGSALVFSTYLGGTVGGDNGNAIAIDTARNVYVTGNTSSLTTNDFPTTSGAYQTTSPSSGAGTSHVFVTKLNPTGSTLLYSTYIGGPRGESAYGIAVDRSGNAFITGMTDSTYPTTSNAFAQSKSAQEDAFVTKLNASGSALIYSTYLGGNGTEWGSAIAIDTSGNAYVTGPTTSTTFPTTTGAFDQVANGGYDVFVTKLNATGSGLLYSSYLGGTNDDNGRRIAVDAVGHAYVVGFSNSTNYPTSNGALITSYAGNPNDGFITKMNTNGTGIIYSTYLGSSNYDVAIGVTVDRKGNAYVSGATESTNFPTTLNAYDRTHNGSTDAFVLKMNPTGTALMYSTFVGGSGADYGNGVKIDQSGNAYVIASSYAGFPTTPGAYDTTNGFQEFAVFKLSIPSLYLKSPIGGEAWCAGSSYSITWNSSAIDSIMIELSNDGGTTYQALTPARISATPGSWNWSIPATMQQGSNYRIRIFDPTSTVFSDTGATFTINRSPAITVPPASQTLCPGQTATFSVTATGVGQTYQWRKNFTNITGATGSTYSIASVQASDAGTYDVVVSGSCAPPATSAGAILAINEPPSVTTPPANDTVCQGASKTFTVSAAGTALAYQWRKDGKDISGATGASYSIFSVLPGHAGSYDVVVSGACSPPAVSAGATLTVIPSPAISRQPRSVELCPGAPVTFGVSVTGAGLSYQWRKDGNDIVGATDSSYTIASVQLKDSGEYDVTINGTCGGSVTSDFAKLVVDQPPKILTEPVNTSVCEGQPAALSVSAGGTGISYQWRRRGTAIPGATSYIFTLPAVTKADTGSYDVIVSGTCQPTDTSNVAVLGISKQTAIAITTQPQSKSVCIGDKITLDVQASGASLRYQWRKNGQDLPGITGSGLTIASAAASDSGSYDVVISSPCGQPVTSNKAAVAIDRSTSIDSQPQDRTVKRGEGVTFTVGASGSGLGYQWRKNGTDLAGATSSSYSIVSVTEADSGMYDVIVSGRCGSPITSKEALLKVEGVSEVPGLADGARATTKLVVVPQPARGRTQLTIRPGQGSVIASDARLLLYNLLGNIAIDLSESFERNDYERAEFDAGELPSGIYSCYLVINGQSERLGIVVIAK